MGPYGRPRASALTRQAFWRQTPRYKEGQALGRPATQGVEWHYDKETERRFGVDQGKSSFG